LNICFPEIKFFKCHFPETNLPNGQKPENQFFKVLIPKVVKIPSIWWLGGEVGSALLTIFWKNGPIFAGFFAGY